MSEKNRLWTPTLNTRCGISEYTQYLGQYADAELWSNLEDHSGPFTDGLVHIQHEHGYFNAPYRLTAYMLRKCPTIPWIVTEHTVRRGTSPEAFELHADTIVVHTASQYRIVKRRATVPVVRIPHGVFDLNVAPKERSDSFVIGAFGFMTRTKGFHKLVDFIESHPKYRLLLLSSLQVQGTFQKKLQKRIKTIPNIIHNSNFLHQDQILETIRNEMDALVYWYSEPSGRVLSASGAINLGLSTGVPILGTHTSWFKDLPVLTDSSLENGIKRLFIDKEIYREQSERQLEYAHQNSWRVTAQRHEDLWRELKQSHAH